MLRRNIGLIKMVVLLLVGQYLLLSCNSSKEKGNLKENDSISTTKNEQKVLELNEVQKRAFDALDSIQRQFEGEHLYSTFPGIGHNCYPPDSSFFISQDELLEVIEDLIDEYAESILIEQFKKLAAHGVLAQKEYVVKSCFFAPRQKDNRNFKILPIANRKAWILPMVLERRDIILAW